MSTALFGIFFLALSGFLAFLYTKQKKKVGKMATLKEISIKEAKVGDEGLFKGVVGGTPVEVPYAEGPVAYYKYSLQQEVVTVKDGRRTRRWKPLRSGESKVPFTVENGGAELQVDPTKLTMQTKEIHKGRAIGLNKNMWKAIQFITQGQLRADLMEKNLKLILDGVPIGAEATLAGIVTDTGAGLMVSKGDSIGGFYLTHDTSQMMKKEKTLQTVFLVGIIVFSIIGIVSIVAGLIK